MSAAQASLSILSDPLSLARLQVLLIPVHHPDAHVGAPVVAVDESQPPPPPLTDEIYEQWTKLFSKVKTLRGDEIQHGPKSSTHRRGTTPHPQNDSPRNRFLPNSAGGSISRTANAANANHVHLAYPSQPPAKHLYPLSLLRLSAFPMVVIGVAVDDELTEGYSLGNENATRRASTKPSNDNLWAQAFTQTLSGLLPQTAAFPLVKRIILVPSTPPIPGSTQRSPVNSTFHKGIHAIQTGEGVVRRAPIDGADVWVQKLLGEVVGQVFGELGELATSLESPNGLKTLSGTLLPSLSATLPHPSSISASPTSMQGDELRINTTASPSNRSPGLVHSNSLPIVPTATMGQHVARALTPGGRPTSVQAPSALPIPSTAIAQVPLPTQSSNPFRRSAALIGRSASGTGPSPGLGSSLMNSSSGITKYTSASLSGVAGGRLLKLLGDIYLITGSYPDAIKCFDEGAERCRAVGDVLWEGLAREGRAVAGIGEAWEGRDGSNLSTPFNTSPIPVEILTHYLSALACLSRAPLPFPPTILSPAPQTPQAAVANGPPGSRPLSLATGGHTAHTGTGEGLLAFLYATLCLRISHFALLIFAAGGWGSIALSSLMTHSLPRSFPALEERGEEASQRRNRRKQLTQLALQSQLSRGTVLGHAEAALGPFRRAMTKAEQLSILVEVVWLARWLEMERKEADTTRQVVKLVANVLSEGRDESRRLTSKTDSAISTTFGSANQGVAIRRREITEGNAGVMELVERVCNAFGIKLVDFEGERSPTTTQGAKEISEARFGWPEMQVEVMKEAIGVAEALPDHASVVRLCVSALKSLHGYLSPSNQNYLAKLYSQSLSTMRRRGIPFDGIPWWLPGRIVLSVEVASLPPPRAPIEHARAELAGGAVQGKKDPFLYNPRLKAPEVGKTVLVANEQVDVFVTLQNVFAFDLEIQDLSLLTTGAPFITTPLPLILPASSIQTVRVSGQAPNAGSLQIRGVNVRLIDGSSAEFLLPVMDSAEQKRDSKRRSRVQTEIMKTKRQGLDARGSMIVAEPTEETHRWLECKVVEEQPLLYIKKTSLSHGTIMLFNGETSTIKITLQNTSSVAVDFVKLSFEDSVSREAQSILAEGELSPEKAYELDNDSVQRPVFTWDNNTDLSIPPGCRTTINVHCLGKVGCTDALIRIDYGFVNRPTEVFHTRQLTFPVLFTVYHTLECYGLDLVSLRSDGPKAPVANGSDNGGGNENGNGNGNGRIRTPTTAQFAKSADAELRSVLTNDEANVLFCVNVRNVYSVPFEVALSTGSSGMEADYADAEAPSPTSDPRAITRLVPPGATERLVLPIPRQSLALEARTRPIPLPSGRQFTVDKTKKTPEEQARLRELFWFREKLLSMVNVSWREPGSLRCGHLSLADQPLSPTQLDSFRLDELNVVLTVTGREQTLHPTDFVDLKITVSNNLERSLRPYVRLEALPTSSTGSSWSMPAPPPAPRRVSSLPAAPMPVPKTVAFDGVLCTMLPTLAAGESATHTIGAVLLASGSYSFRAAAEEVVAVAPIQPPLVCFSPAVTVDVA